MTHKRLFETERTMAFNSAILCLTFSFSLERSFSSVETFPSSSVALEALASASPLDFCSASANCCSS